MSISNRIKWLCSALIILNFGLVSAQAPEITAVGNQVYCPLSEIPVVTDFDILNPGGNEIEKIHIQISTGYESSFDRLEFLGHPNVTASSFNIQQGKITLSAQNSGSQGLADLIAAVKAVVFRSNSSSISGEKIFSFTLGDANYLEQTGHFYEYVSDVGITWTEARAAAESRYNEYGWQGYLATILSAEEAAICGEQAQGAGWIGGSDSETEGEWKWVTGPDTDHITFWIGEVNGYAPNNAYANWNKNPDSPEPNNLGNEDYAHITDDSVAIPLGSWNDLNNTGGSSGAYQPKGYIVEYGGMDPNETPISTISSKIYVPELVVDDGARCGPGSVSLTASVSVNSPVSDVKVLWYNTPAGGTNIGEGLNFTTQHINSDTTFYSLASVNGCTEGIRTPVVARILPIPTVTAADVIICGAGQAQLTATASAGAISWFSAPSGGTPLGFGPSYETPLISSTTTYYIAAVENGCATTPRVPVTATVVYTSSPMSNSPQFFCENSSPTVQNLTSIGDNIKWYTNATSGSPLATDEPLTSSTYYVSQTVSGCESPVRTPVDVVVYESPKPKPATELQPITVCDDELDGSGINGFSSFDITLNEADILNSQSPAEFSVRYYWLDDYSPAHEIQNPSDIINTNAFKQTIYVRVTNNLDNGCYNDTSFEIEVFDMPQIVDTLELKNCDEDGVTDGYTDYNLNEANSLISANAANETISHYLTLPEAQNATNPVNSSSFNNIDSDTVFVRVETTNGCYKIATISLKVSATAFSDNYNFEIQACESDDINDGITVFDLSAATNEILGLLPPGQPLQVYYYTNLNDALLEINEIQTPDNYTNETSDSQDLYVRIENEENGDCYDIGPYVTLTVNRRPEFTIVPEALVCMNLPPIVLDVLNADGIYSYEWIDESGNSISSAATAEIGAAGIYTVIATSALGCESLPRTVTVNASVTALVDNSAITTIENSMNNSIDVDASNFGIGDYEFALNDMDGPYSDSGFFDQLQPGIHTLYVRDKNGCGITAHDVYILGFQKYFSPNGDGIHDYWQVQGLDPATMQASPVRIFDRYGKILTAMDAFGNGWDGTFNGKILPATEYWYNVIITDASGRIRNLIGHFSLLR